MYTFDNKSIIHNDKRWFPIMGEIHYSRYPNQYWKESLYKMKAGGVDIISTYVIWIHHEEIENQYDFNGDRNLHDFVKACQECNMKLLLRIGPWCHGEARNGGFPDWLLKKDFEVRTNDEKYFSTIEKWYKKIFQQVSEFFDNKETNPIIGVQIENEFGHCGGLYDETGEIHMQRLYKMAKEIGFNVDLYTATGWGGARTGGLLPVMGGYCDAPWDPSTEEIEPSGNFVFTHERNDHNIGSDHGFGYGITFDLQKFPYLTAELGGGLQVTKHRRTIATAQDISAVSLVKLGSGVNLLGYYMYHGGTNPEGKLTTLQESKETGYPNDLPVKSYDFRAPVREYGQISDTFKELKLLTSFIHSFGTELCELPAAIPQDNPLDPKDTTQLRYSFRTDNNKGYVFISNYVRHQKLSQKDNILIKTPNPEIIFENLSIEDGDYFFLPFNINFGKNLVKKAQVTPLCSLSDGTTVFYTRKNEKGTKDFFDFHTKPENTPQFLVLSRQDALNSWNTEDGNLFITNGTIVKEDNQKIYLTGREKLIFSSYKPLLKTPAGFIQTELSNKNIAEDLPAYNFTTYEKNLPIEKGSLNTITQSCQLEKMYININLNSLINRLKAYEDYSDCFIQINYQGDSAQLYGTEDGKRVLLADNFYIGKDYPWEIGLKRFINQNIDFTTLELQINALKDDVPIYLEEKIAFNDKYICAFNGIKYEFEEKVRIL